MRRQFAFGLVLLAVTACSEHPPTGPDGPGDAAAASQLEAAASFAPAGATYRVSVTNLTSAQAFTPPLVATHRPPVSVFRVGQDRDSGRPLALFTSLSPDQAIGVLLALHGTLVHGLGLTGTTRHERGF